MNTMIEVLDAKEIQQRFSSALLRAQKVIVTDKASHGDAQQALGDVHSAMQAIHGEMDPRCRKAQETHAFLCNIRSSLLFPWEYEKERLGSECIAYEEAEKRRVADERARLEAEARKQEEERILAEASQYEKAGDREMAQAVLSQEITAPPVHVETELAEVNGSSTRSTWKGEVLDVLAFVRFVAEHSEYLSCITFSASALNAIAKSQKNMCRIPGFRAVEEKSKVTRESRKF